MASEKTIYTEKIYKVMWDSCTWLVSGKNECKREATRLKVLHPHDEITVTEKTITIKEIEY